MNVFFVLSLKENTVRTGHTTYFLPKVVTKDCNVTINGKNFFDQSIRNSIKTYEDIQKKLLLIKDMITKLAFYYIVFVSKKIIS